MYFLVGIKLPVLVQPQNHLSSFSIHTKSICTVKRRKSFHALPVVIFIYFSHSFFPPGFFRNLFEGLTSLFFSSHFTFFSLLSHCFPFYSSVISLAFQLFPSVSLPPLCLSCTFLSESSLHQFFILSGVLNLPLSPFSSMHVSVWNSHWKSRILYGPEIF